MAEQTRAVLILRTLTWIVSLVSIVLSLAVSRQAAQARHLVDDMRALLETNTALLDTATAQLRWAVTALEQCQDGPGPTARPRSVHLHAAPEDVK